MIVSLEAIFLSTFVMIGQNRDAARRRVIASEQWTTVREGDKQNEELLDFSRQILELTKRSGRVAACDASAWERRAAAAAHHAIGLAPALLLWRSSTDGSAGQLVGRAGWCAELAGVAVLSP
jgi:uncharacterized membrane protein